MAKSSAGIWWASVRSLELNAHTGLRVQRESYVACG